MQGAATNRMGDMNDDNCIYSVLYYLERSNCIHLGSDYPSHPVAGLVRRTRKQCMSKKTMSEDETSISPETTDKPRRRAQNKATTNDC